MDQLDIIHAVTILKSHSTLASFNAEYQASSKLGRAADHLMASLSFDSRMLCHHIQMVITNTVYHARQEGRESISLKNFNGK